MLNSRAGLRKIARELLDGKLYLGEEMSRQKFNNEVTLMEDEKIVWQGSPVPGLRFRKTYLLSLTFVLFICWSVAMLVSIIAREISSVMIFVGLLILFLIAAVISEISIKTGFSYTLTDKRVMATLHYLREPAKFFSIDLQSIRSIDVSTGDDTGVITFNKAGTLLHRLFGADGIFLSPSFPNHPDPVLVDIPRPREVVRMIEQHRDILFLHSKHQLCKIYRFGLFIDRL